MPQPPKPTSRHVPSPPRARLPDTRPTTPDHPDKPSLPVSRPCRHASPPRTAAAPTNRPHPRPTLTDDPSLVPVAPCRRATSPPSWTYRQADPSPVHLPPTCHHTSPHAEPTSHPTPRRPSPEPSRQPKPIQFLALPLPSDKPTPRTSVRADYPSPRRPRPGPADNQLHPEPGRLPNPALSAPTIRPVCGSSRSDSPYQPSSLP